MQCEQKPPCHQCVYCLGERVTKLEVEEVKCRYIIGKILERLDAIEAKQQFLETNWKKINRLELELDELEAKQPDQSQSNITVKYSPSQPYKCPVCCGTGCDAAPHNTEDACNSCCHPCKGKGIVWG